MDLLIEKNTEKILEIREGWKGYYLFVFILWVSAILISFILPNKRQDTIEFFFTQWNLTKLLIFLIIFGIPAISLFYYFDKRVKIKIDHLGIWSKKHGTVFWTTISSYKTKQVYQKEGDSYEIILQLKAPEDEKEIRIEFRRMDKEIDEIRATIDYYAVKNGIDAKEHKKGWF